MNNTQLIPVKIEAQPEVYAGDPTGKTLFVTSRVGLGIYGAVLGRGYTRESSLEDFIRRANAESYTKVKIGYGSLDVQE